MRNLYSPYANYVKPFDYAGKTILKTTSKKTQNTKTQKTVCGTILKQLSLKQV